MKNEVLISDLAFEAIAGISANPGESSIAAFTSNSHVRILRATLEAHKAVDGEDGTTEGVDGAWKNEGALGPGMECKCTTGGSSTGGTGGDVNENGTPGESDPDIDEKPAAQNGAAGIGGPTMCTGEGATGSGNPGADAPAGDSGVAPPLGTLMVSGWLPGDGADGADGGPGQGGGGGGGRAGGPGGGGGCGGCGGTKGTGGTGGGSSVALLSFESEIMMNDCTLLTDKGGNGGAGKGGGNGSGGNPGVSVGGTGCSGGDGGKGGNGGAGSGGAGGISAGILFKGATKPIIDDKTTFNKDRDAAGLAGQGGKSPDNDGPSGVVGKMVNIDSP